MAEELSRDGQLLPNLLARCADMFLFCEQFKNGQTRSRKRILKSLSLVWSDKRCCVSSVFSRFPGDDRPLSLKVVGVVGRHAVCKAQSVSEGGKVDSRVGLNVAQNTSFGQFIFSMFSATSDHWCDKGQQQHHFHGFKEEPGYQKEKKSTQATRDKPTRAGRGGRWSVVVLRLSTFLKRCGIGGIIRFLLRLISLWLHVRHVASQRLGGGFGLIPRRHEQPVGNGGQEHQQQKPSGPNTSHGKVMEALIIIALVKCFDTLERKHALHVGHADTHGCKDDEQQNTLSFAFFLRLLNGDRWR